MCLSLYCNDPLVAQSQNWVSLCKHSPRDWLNCVAAWRGFRFEPGLLVSITQGLTGGTVPQGCPSAAGESVALCKRAL